MAILKPDPPQAHFLPWRGPGSSITWQPHPASPHPSRGSEEPRGFSCEGAGFAQGEGHSSGSPTTRLTAAGRRLRLWGDGGVGVGRESGSRVRPQRVPTHPIGEDVPAGIRQGLRSIRPQGSHPRLLLQRERASGKSHEPSGCQQTLSNRHPHLEAKDLELLQRVRKGVRITLYRVSTGYLHPPQPITGRAALGTCRGARPSRALPSWNCLPSGGKTEAKHDSVGHSWGHPALESPSTCPTLTEAPDPHLLLQLQPRKHP